MCPKSAEESHGKLLFICQVRSVPSEVTGLNFFNWKSILFLVELHPSKYTFMPSCTYACISSLPPTSSWLYRIQILPTSPGYSHTFFFFFLYVVLQSIVILVYFSYSNILFSFPLQGLCTFCPKCSSDSLYHRLLLIFQASDIMSILQRSILCPFYLKQVSCFSLL